MFGVRTISVDVDVIRWTQTVRPSNVCSGEASRDYRCGKEPVIVPSTTRPSPGAIHARRKSHILCPPSPWSQFDADAVGTAGAIVVAEILLMLPEPWRTTAIAVGAVTQR